METVTLNTIGRLAKIWKTGQTTFSNLRSQESGPFLDRG